MPDEGPTPEDTPEQLPSGEEALAAIAAPSTLPAVVSRAPTVAGTSLIPADNGNGRHGDGRGVVPGLGTPRSYVDLLPAVYQEHLWTQQFMGGFDDSIAPIISTLDCLSAYVDPYLCPPDFLEWLSGWVGLVLDENWPEDRRRATVAHAVELYRMRGTVAGMRAEVQIFTGGAVEINDNGGCVWSATPGGEFPGEPVPRLAVRVLLDDESTVTEAAVDAIVSAAKPGHVVHAIELVKRR